MLSQHDWHCRLSQLTNLVLNVLKDSLNIDKKDNTVCCEICQRAKQTRESFPLSDHKFFLTVVDDYTRAVCVYLIKSKDEISNDDERVANDLNKDKSDSSSSSVSGSNINTADFPVDYGNDVDSSDNIVATQNEEVAKLEENVFSKSNLDNHPSSSQGVQNVRREPKTYFEASKFSHWTDAMNQEMNALLRNGTWELVDLPGGFRQKEEINYEETFSPVVKMVTIRCLLNIAVSMSWSVFQIDVNNAFLYGDLEEATRQWNAKLTSTLIENGFSQSKSDYSLYTKSDKGMFLALLVYVDDIIITVVDTDKGICLNQRKYVLDLLSKYGMLACKPAKTPIMSKLVISNEESDKDPLLKNITDYQKLMGKLIYLTNIRPDISYDVHCLSQFMHSPLTSHLKIAFKILRYLKSCPGKSVTGYCVFLNNSLIFWKSKKQNILSKSSTEAEYRALASVTSEVIWILKILKDLQIENLLPVSLHCDSNSAIKITTNPVFHKRTKHLEIDLHFVREKVLKGVVKTVKVDS
ncbi:ribonuclease H-like domain-containing protein [Tanacetum coccineum]